MIHNSMFQNELEQPDTGTIQSSSFMSSRRATLVSPAVRAVGGVNAGQLPFAPPAILSPTAVRAARGPGVVTASVASQATGTTNPPAARVSHLSVIRHVECSLGLAPRPFVKMFDANNAFPEEKAAPSTHVPTPTTTVVRMMSENPLPRAVTLWPDDITM